MKNHSHNLHAPLCDIFCPNLVSVTRYDALIRTKSPINCDAHLVESIFQTYSSQNYLVIHILILHRIRYLRFVRWKYRNLFYHVEVQIARKKLRSPSGFPELTCFFGFCKQFFVFFIHCSEVCKWTKYCFTLFHNL